VFLTSVSLLRRYGLWACVSKFWLQSWVCFFSAVTSAFQLFTCKLCLQTQDWGCVILREIDFLLKICWSIPCLHPSWKVDTWIEICSSLNHRKKTKADGSRLIPRKHTETLVLLIEYRIFCHRPSHWWRRVRDHVEGWRKLAKIQVVANVLQTFVMKILIVNAAKQDRSKYA